MSYQSRKQKKPLEIEADLYTAVATMDKLSSYFDKGYVGETIYRRQLKSCINEVYKAKNAMEQQGKNLEDFIEREQLRDKYPEGLRRLDLVEGSTEDRLIGTRSDLPAKATDFVAESIELIDLLKLRSIAKVEYIVPLLDEIISILSNFPTIPNDHWSLIEANGWRDQFLGESPSKLLDDATAEKLEFDASRWLSDFRKRLKEM